MKSKLLVALFASSVLFFAGCGSSQPEPEMETEVATQPENEQVDEKIDEAKVEEEVASKEVNVEDSAELYTAKFVQDGANSYYEMLVNVDGNNVLVKLPIIFFAFDKFSLTSDEDAKVRSFAEYVKENNLQGQTLEVGGHCDEWGSDEYNFALGLKRAKSVENALKGYGVDLKVNVVSFGESKALCQEHTKSCWKENRRSEIKFLP